MWISSLCCIVCCNRSLILLSYRSISSYQSTICISSISRFYQSFGSLYFIRCSSLSSFPLLSQFAISSTTWHRPKGDQPTNQFYLGFAIDAHFLFVFSTFFILSKLLYTPMLYPIPTHTLCCCMILYFTWHYYQLLCFNLIQRINQLSAISNQSTLCFDLLLCFIFLHMLYCSISFASLDYCFTFYFCFMIYCFMICALTFICVVIFCAIRPSPWQQLSQ